MDEKDSLKDRRKKVNNALQRIVGSFKEIESDLSPWQKKWGMRGLGDENWIRYQPLEEFAGIVAEYTDIKGNRYEIKINHKPSKI
jgi:hypothetical protein